MFGGTFPICLVLFPLLILRDKNTRQANDTVPSQPFPAICSTARARNRSPPGPAPVTFGNLPRPEAKTEGEPRFLPSVSVGFASGDPQPRAFCRPALQERPNQSKLWLSTIARLFLGKGLHFPPSLPSKGWLNPDPDFCLPPLAAPPIKSHVKFISPSFIKINQLSNAQKPVIRASSVSRRIRVSKASSRSAYPHIKASQGAAPSLERFGKVC